MTPSDASAVPLRGATRAVAPRRSSRDNAAFVAERLAARRKRVQTIRKWVVTFAVALFLTVAIVIVAQSRLVTTSSAATGGSSSSAGGATSSTSGSSSAAGSSSSTSASGTSSSSGSISPVTSSQS